MNNSEINVFIELIYSKVYKKFNTLFKYLSHKSKVRKFTKEIENGSPSFDTLWQMADFIKIAELVFCYDNSIKNTEIGLYSSKNYSEGTNGFKIKDLSCNITIKLFSKSKQVALEVERINGEKLRTSINFINEQWEHSPNIYEEMVLEQVIKIINKRILMLFNYCYELR